jgi:hypothetical protein
MQTGADNTMELEQTEESVNFDEEISDDLRFQPEDMAQEELELNGNLDRKEPSQNSIVGDSFVDGLAVGLGLGSITSFAIVWVSLFFSPLLPQSATYESLLATFIYPLIYLLGIGLVALTAGVVREYYSKTKL